MLVTDKFIDFCLPIYVKTKYIPAITGMDEKPVLCILVEEYRLRVLKSRMQREMFRPTKEEVLKRLDKNPF
jgi:hypothetical protein